MVSWSEKNHHLPEPALAVSRRFLVEGSFQVGPSPNYNSHADSIFNKQLLPLIIIGVYYTKRFNWVTSRSAQLSPGALQSNTHFTVSNLQ